MTDSRRERPVYTISARSYGQSHCALHKMPEQFVASRSVRPGQTTIQIRDRVKKQSRSLFLHILNLLLGLHRPSLSS